MTHNNNPSVDLIHALVEHLSGAQENWDQLAIVLYFDGTTFRGTYGYTYSADGTHAAVASRPSAVRPAVEAYVTSTFQTSETLPVKVLVQFDRTSGKYEFIFEDTDTTRWAVSPATVNEISEELRPRLGN